VTELNPVLSANDFDLTYYGVTFLCPLSLPLSCLREEVRDVLELRKAVKQEAVELELQLTDLVHRYDDSFKMVGYRHAPDRGLY
jgi:hypothetical protein